MMTAARTRISVLARLAVTLLAVSGPAMAVCDRSALPQIRALMDVAQDAVQRGDYATWQDLILPAYSPGDVDIEEIREVFEMYRVDGKEAWEVFAGDLDIEEFLSEDGKECWVFPVQHGLRANGAAVFKELPSGWAMLTTSWPADCLGESDTVDGVRLMICTQGNQQVFARKGPEWLSVSFEIDPGRDARVSLERHLLDLEGHSLRLEVVPLAGDSPMPTGRRRFEAEPGSSGRDLSLLVEEIEGSSLLQHPGRYRVVAIYEASRNGWWQGRLESNPLWIEIKE